MTCILCMDFAMAMHLLLLKNTKRVFPIEVFRLEVYLREFTRHCVILVLFRVLLLQSEREVVRLINTRESILQVVQRSPRLSTRRMASRIGVSCTQVWQTLHEEDLYPYHDQRVHLEPGDYAQRMDLCHWIKKLIPNC